MVRVDWIMPAVSFHSLLFLIACGSGHPDDTGMGAGSGGEHDSADEDVDTDTDSGTDIPEDPCLPSGGTVDTATCELRQVGEITTNDGAFVAGHRGYEVYSMRTDSAACEALAEWSDDGARPTPCPGCSWAFDLTLANGNAIGPACEQYGLDGTGWNGITETWAFAATYSWTYGEITLEFDNVLFRYEGDSEGSGWELFAYQFRGAGTTSGDETHISFDTWAPYPYYYY